MMLMRAGTAAGAVLACLMTIGAAAPAKADTAFYVSQIELLATAYCPVGMLDADGRTLQIAQYQVLFALFGITYGGDGSQDFKLPDLRGKEPLDGMRYCIVVEGMWPEHP